MKEKSGGVEDFGTVSINLESQDESDPQAPSDMPLWTSGKKTIGNLFKDISTAIKNTRYLMKLIGDLGKKVEIPSADGKYRFNAYMNIDNWGWIEVENTETGELSRLQLDTQGTALQLWHRQSINDNYLMVKNFFSNNEYWGGWENIGLEANVWKRCQRFISVPKGQYMLVWHAKLNPGQPKREVCIHISCEPSSPMLELWTSFSSMDYFDALHTSSCFINIWTHTSIYIDLISTVNTEVKEVEICAIKLT